MKRKFSIRGRIISLFLLFAVVLCIYAVAIYDLQVANRDEYISSEGNITYTTETVSAARGDILDRYGRVLVTNTESYNLKIDMSEVKSQNDPNGTVLDIINFATEVGCEYTDTFPVSSDAQFKYKDNMSSIQEYRLEEYRKFFDLDENISAPELITFMVNHYEIDSSKYTNAEIRKIIGVRYESEIRSVVNISSYIFAENVSSDIVAKVLEQGVIGLEVETTSKRVYNTQYAAHILGYIGLMDEEEYAAHKDKGYAMDAYIGKSGVEQTFEEYLRGTDGTVKIGTNSDGVVVSVETEEETVPGNDIMLTIDIGLQEAAEKALAARIEGINSGREEDEELATGGAVVAIEVGTGDVLAMASYPTYNLSTYFEDYEDLVNDDSNPLFNRATQGTYSPGSTFKMVTATAALGENVISTGTTIEDRGVYTKYASSEYAPKCWIYPYGTHGSVNVMEAIRDSCNYFFYVIGDATGIDNIATYAAWYGLGQPTGIELPEEVGILSSRTYKESVKNETWYVGDTLQTAIGQMYNLFTPLQLANYTATIASDGDRYSAHILENVINYSGDEIIDSYEPNILSTVEVTDSTFWALKQGMLMVSEGGTTADLFKDYPVRVASKTGTVQSDASSINNGVFVCFAPYDNPEIAIAVVIENGGSGSAVGQVAKDVLDYYFSDEHNTGINYTENSLNK